MMSQATKAAVPPLTPTAPRDAPKLSSNRQSVNVGLASTIETALPMYVSVLSGSSSIVAKVYRDARMRELDARYPGYGFAKHKGYGTREHLRALERLGPCPAHRRSFTPVSQLALFA